MFPLDLGAGIKGTRPDRKPLMAWDLFPEGVKHNSANRGIASLSNYAKTNGEGEQASRLVTALGGGQEELNNLP